jgi:hypothetical protein
MCIGDHPPSCNQLEFMGSFIENNTIVINECKKITFTNQEEQLNTAFFCRSVILLIFEWEVQLRILMQFYK